MRVAYLGVERVRLFGFMNVLFHTASEELPE